MSLINDALKRASQSDRNRQRETRKPTPMQPVGGPPPKSSSMAPVLAVCVVLALGLAAWFFFQWWHVRRPVETVKTERAAVPPPVARPAAPPVAAAPPPEPVVAAPPPPKTVPVPIPEPAQAPPPAQAVPPPWPVELKLMGIFYSQTSPQALINARTVNVGDEIEGIRVTKIARDAVTVEWNGQTKQLTLE